MQLVISQGRAGLALFVMININPFRIRNCRLKSDYEEKKVIRKNNPKTLANPLTIVVWKVCVLVQGQSREVEPL